MKLLSTLIFAALLTGCAGWNASESPRLRHGRRLNVAVYAVPDAYVRSGTKNSGNVPRVELFTR